MMQSIFILPSRTALASLTETVNGVAPSVALGFARRLTEGRVAVVFSSRLGLSEQVVDESDVPGFLQPSSGEIQQARIDAGGFSSVRAVEWQLRFIGVDSLLSIPIPALEPPTRFWIGLASPNVFSREQIGSLEGLGASYRQTLTAPMSLDEEVERLRRLELAAELFPALLHVLDVREVFDRLSDTANRALPHDWLLLRRFNDDLSTTDVFARSGQEIELSSSSVSAVYPPEVLRAWRFSIIDDLTIRPPDADQPVVERGARSALRLSIRFDDRLIGALVFLSLEQSKYTMSDLAVGRRLADHVAGALSHHALAERLVDQARQSEELRTRATSLELLDELLAAIMDSGNLADVFGRISATTRKVLAHDAALLMVRLPDGVHARTYASSGFSPPLPQVTAVPQELVQNPDWEHHIFRDISGSEPRYRTLADRGFNSLLRVPIRLDGEFAGALVFLSKALSSFVEPDILVARRIADRLALTLAHDREIQAARRADEAIERAAKLEARVRALTDELDSRTGYRRVVGESASWRQVLKQATQVAATDTTVLLLGESGTGKEVIARFLHRASPRKNGPYVALNCAALPEQLLEAELFGYERGAFTGATQSKPGQLEQAAGGTLFLDEVGEMSPSAQAKFLRVLQEREFQRLGGTRVLRTDARVVAATNRDLERAIVNGQFRQDLYYRLNVFAIRLPPLRDRRDDILPLSEAFVGEIGRSLGRPPAGISRDARKVLVEYRWPGNVRELRNILERAAILCDGGLIAAEHLALDVSAVVSAKPVNEPIALSPMAAGAPFSSDAQPTSPADLQTMERTMIEQALQSARFNKSKAAKALGLSRHQLYIRMRRYGFE